MPPPRGRRPRWPASGWRSSGSLSWPVKLLLIGVGEPEAIRCAVEETPDGYSVTGADGIATRLVAVSNAAPRYVFEIDGLRRAIHAVRDADGAWHVQDGARLWVFELPAASSASAAAHATGPVAPMSGRVAEIFVAAGEAVEKGGLLMTLEAMKMYHEIRAGRAGRVAELLVAVGQQVDPRQALLKLEDAA